MARVLEGYLHGVNLGGWLSQCDHTKKRYDTFITEADFATIRSWGMDHVRVPVDYELVEDADGNYIEEGFGYISKAIEWAKKNGLHMILDLHKTFGYSFDLGYGESGFFDNEAYQERFYRLWEEFAKRYGSDVENVVFELLNEVTSKDYSDTWNRVSTTCIGRIRRIAPDIRIIIGGYYNNSIEALVDLAAPVDDKVVYTFHCYEPLIFTHQGAPWVDGMDTSFRMPFATTYAQYQKFSSENVEAFKNLELAAFKGFGEDQILGVEYFERMLEEAVRVASERDVALYCGEFGVIDRADPKDALAWYKTFIECMDRHGIGRAAWSYKQMDFGLVDARMDEVRDEILKLI